MKHFNYDFCYMGNAFQYREKLLDAQNYQEYLDMIYAELEKRTRLIRKV